MASHEGVQSFFHSNSSQRYDIVSTSDTETDSELVVEKAAVDDTPRRRLSVIKVLALICTFIGGGIIVFALGYTAGYHDNAEPQPDGAFNTSSNAIGACTSPYYRREWRSLSEEEKQNYLDAFQCFIDSPSVLGFNGSLYNDFAWAHNRVARGTHGKAPFLTWHRRFIFVYENYLRETCDYKGALPFWDWTLDWEDPASSPIFDHFGHGGDPEASKYGASHCVTDLPFKNLKPQWHGDEYDPHCLTRWFDEDWFGHYMNPEAMEDIMTSETYADFFLAVEMGPHDIIPMGIRGDFTSFTAPNDPIFYLHHSQLDRIWWLWQSRDRENRIFDYDGGGEHGNVTLSDTLVLSGLDADIPVVDIMDTEGGGMCYRYMYT